MLLRNLREEAKDLIREHSAVLVEFQMLPDFHRRDAWMLVGVCSDGDSINLGGGMLWARAKAAEEAAGDYLLDYRSEMDVPDYLIPTQQDYPTQEPCLTEKNAAKVQEISKPDAKVCLTGREMINMRLLLWELGSLSLDEISKKRIVPPGFWEAGGGHRRAPRDIQWQRMGVDDRGERHRISFLHQTLDGKSAVCGPKIPPATTHKLITDGSEARQCKVCLYQLRKWGYIT